MIHVQSFHNTTDRRVFIQTVPTAASALATISRTDHSKLVEMFLGGMKTA